jgi:hypothetical protein
VSRRCFVRTPPGRRRDPLPHHRRPAIPGPGGDPTEIEKAKSAFKSVLIGYALAPILLAVVKGWIGG